MSKFTVDVDSVEVNDEDIFEYVQENFDPDNIFDEEELSKWAIENGFVKEE